jgi:hypothetical protein
VGQLLSCLLGSGLADRLAGGQDPVPRGETGGEGLQLVNEDEAGTLRVLAVIPWISDLPPPDLSPILLRAVGRSGSGSDGRLMSRELTQREPETIEAPRRTV